MLISPPHIAFKYSTDISISHFLSSLHHSFLILSTHYSLSLHYFAIFSSCNEQPAPWSKKEKKITDKRRRQQLASLDVQALWGVCLGFCQLSSRKSCPKEPNGVRWLWASTKPTSEIGIREKAPPGVLPVASRGFDTYS